MADTIAVMNAGRIEQLGDPATLYEHPRATFVANFLGQSNLLRAAIERPGLRRHGVRHVPRRSGSRRRCLARRAPGASWSVWLGVRPEKLRLGEDGGPEPAARRGHRRLVHRGRDAVPRAAAVGPGAHRGPAERRLGRARRGRERHGLVGEPARVRPRRRRSPPTRDWGTMMRSRSPRPCRARAESRFQPPARRRDAATGFPTPCCCRGCCGCSSSSSCRWSPWPRSRCRTATSTTATRSPATSPSTADALDALLAAARALVRVRRYRHRAGAAPRLPARLLHRGPPGPLEVRPAGAGDRAVLHELPDPHAGLADASSPTSTPSRGSPAGPTSPTSCSSLGLTNNDSLLSSKFAVICGLTYNFLPFMVLPLYSSLDRVDGTAPRGRPRPLRHARR